MKEIVLLINRIARHEFKNFMLLSNALIRSGNFEVKLGLIDSLCIEDTDILCETFRLSKEIAENDELDGKHFNFLVLKK